MDGQTILIEATYFSAIAVTMGGANKDSKELRAMMKQLTASVTAQAATLAALSTETNSGGGDGGGKNTGKKKARLGLYMCAHCKREVYHKEGNCLELEANKAKRYTGWRSALE